MITEILLLSTFSAMLKYYIYETNVLFEYLKYIPKFLPFNFTKKLFYGKLMFPAYTASQQSNYLIYINSVYNNFFTKLISCPICLGFWVAVLLSIIFTSSIIYIPLIAFNSLFLYYILKLLTKYSSYV